MENYPNSGPARRRLLITQNVQTLHWRTFRLYGWAERASLERCAAAQDGGGRTGGEQVRVPPLPGRLPAGQGPGQAQGEAVHGLVQRRLRSKSSNDQTFQIYLG